jgi:hypothetical protein
MLLTCGSTLPSRRASRSFAGSLMVRGLERDGAAATDPASEDRESSWNVVGLMFRLDIAYSSKPPLLTLVKRQLSF